MRDRVRLLAENGVDLLTPFDDPFFDHCHGRTPAQWAMLCGNDVIVRTLVAHGGDPTPRDEVDDFVGSVMAGDTGTISTRSTSHHVGAPCTTVATGAGRRDRTQTSRVRGADRRYAISTSLGRADSPCEMPWQTALHTAVEKNNAEIVELLLKLGADPTINDARFNATPKGWAEHFGNERMAALLP